MSDGKGKVNIHGKQYETVASRVSRFRAEKPNHAIETDIVMQDSERVVMKAVIKLSGEILASGHAEEVRKASPINKTSALENCETSAIGRALACFGYLGTEFASADEVANAIIPQTEAGKTEKTTTTTGKTEYEEFVIKMIDESALSQAEKDNLKKQYNSKTDEKVKKAFFEGCIVGKIKMAEKKTPAQMVQETFTDFDDDRIPFEKYAEQHAQEKQQALPLI